MEQTKPTSVILVVGDDYLQGGLQMGGGQSMGLYGIMYTIPSVIRKSLIL